MTTTPPPPPRLLPVVSFDSSTPAPLQRYNALFGQSTRQGRTTGITTLEKKDWQIEDYVLDHYTNANPSLFNPYKWSAFLNATIPPGLIKDPMPNSKHKWKGPHRPRNAWDVLTYYQSGLWNETPDKKVGSEIKLAINNRINNHILDYLFTISPQTTQPIWVYRCETTRSVATLIENPCITRHLSTTLSGIYALRGEFCNCTPEQFDYQECMKKFEESGPTPEGLNCNDPRVKNRPGFNVIAIYIPAGSHIIPIWLKNPTGLDSVIPGDFESQKGKVKSHDFYTYQKEVLLPRGGWLTPIWQRYPDGTEKDEIECKHFENHPGLNFIPAFEYSSPNTYVHANGSTNRIRHTCDEYLQMEMGNDRDDRLYKWHQLWDQHIKDDTGVYITRTLPGPTPPPGYPSQKNTLAGRKTKKPRATKKPPAKSH